MSAPDLDRAALVLTALVEQLTRHIARSETVLEALRSGEPADSDSALSEAEAGIGQIQALACELDVYWPPGPDGRREAGDRSAELAALCDQVADLCERAKGIEELQGTELVGRLARTAEELRGARRTRRTSTRYRGPMTPPGSGLVDVRT